MLAVPDVETLPLRTDAHGVVRIGQTRVTLDTVVTVFNQGATAEEIAQRFPTLNLADIYSVIGYYLRHREAVDTYLACERVKLGESMPGVIEVSLTTPIGTIIEELIVLLECSYEGEWEGQVLYIPFH